MRLELRAKCYSRISISIHAPRMRCDWMSEAVARGRIISIHAPRMRCDGTYEAYHTQEWQISIHAPRMRCDETESVEPVEPKNFNPRTSYEMRHDDMLTCCAGSFISIHAPRMRCDVKDNSENNTLLKFQSTHLV